MNDDLYFEQQTPRSARYNDIYYSRENGLEESRYVFLQGNGIPKVWRNKKKFVIAETGFGTGLNFFCAWQAWKNDPHGPESLHYISVEKYPLDATQIATAQIPFTEFDPLVEQLCVLYPVHPNGMHRIWLDKNRVCLTLCFMDASEALTSLSAKVDAWFLDGFAPAQNPDMWSENVTAAIARLSDSGTTLATFTAAGAVKRRLEAQGFNVSRVKGFGQKKQMITATLEDRPHFRNPTPWFEYPDHKDTEKRAVVVGAGIGGSQIARSLANRGWQVTVIERNHAVAKEASGNPAAVIAPRMTASPSLDEQFSVQCYQFALNQLQTMQQDTSIWHPCGVLWLAHNQTKQVQLESIRRRNLSTEMLQCLSCGQASEIAGLPLLYDAIYFPKAGFVRPISLVAALLDHPAISLVTNSPVLSLKQIQDQWEVYGNNGETIALAKTVILATGKNLNFDCLDDMPHIPVQGQTSLSKADPSTNLLSTVIQHDGYITPSIDQFHILGSTYKRNVTSIGPNSAGDIENLTRQRRNLGSYADNLAPVLPAHCAIRVTTASRMPFVGPVADGETLRQNFRPMLRRSFFATDYPPSYYTGLYFAGAFGSRGMTNAALCAELLASQICGEPLPIQVVLGHCVHPARHIVQQLKRNS